MRHFASLVVLVAALMGCSAIPFRPPELVPLDDRTPAAVVEEFQRHMPERFRLLSSIVFDFPWHRMSAIGMTEVDARNGTFTALALTPMGVKLFEITGDRSEIDPRFVLEPLRQRGDAAQAIGEDIRRIYLGLLPSPKAKAHSERKRIIFRDRLGDGSLEHVFAGADGFLVEKTYHEGDVLVWRVRYYEYQRLGSYAYPMGIVFDNMRYGYRLIVRIKEILA